MNNNVTSAGTEAESSTKDEFLPSAPLAANPMLAAGLTMSAIEIDFPGSKNELLSILFKNLSLSKLVVYILIEQSSLNFY